MKFCAAGRVIDRVGTAGGFGAAVMFRLRASRFFLAADAVFAEAEWAGFRSAFYRRWTGIHTDFEAKAAGGSWTESNSAMAGQAGRRGLLQKRTKQTKEEEVATRRHGKKVSARQNRPVFGFVVCFCSGDFGIQC